jgi:hypothetical protein
MTRCSSGFVLEGQEFFSAAMRAGGAKKSHIAASRSVPGPSLLEREKFVG